MARFLRLGKRGFVQRSCFSTQPSLDTPPLSGIKINKDATQGYELPDTGSSCGPTEIEHRQFASHVQSASEIRWFDADGPTKVYEAIGWDADCLQP